MAIRAKAEVTHVESAKSDLITSFGIYRGVEIRLIQKRPCFVVQCEDSEIALETALADSIWVELTSGEGEI